MLTGGGGADRFVFAAGPERDIVADYEDGVDKFQIQGFKGNIAALEITGEPVPLATEQSNVSVVFGDSAILKIYRRLREGEQPDVEVARFLTEVAKFPNTPAFLGSIEHRPSDGEPSTLAAAFAYVRNQGDAWEVLTSALHRDLEESATVAADGAPVHDFAPPLDMADILGRRTAELHRAFAVETDDGDFDAEPITVEDLKAWTAEAAAEISVVMDSLKRAESNIDKGLTNDLNALLELREVLVGRIRAVAGMAPSGGKSRIHGDYHLGQVLVVQNDVFIIDFEGEPRRSLEQRRAKTSPLRDVAGLLRSLDYAAASASQRLPVDGPSLAVAKTRALAWRDRASADFLAAYRQGIAGSRTDPDDAAFAEALLDLFLIQKAAYEIGYELANRPTWLEIPVRGLLDIAKRIAASS